MIYPWLLYLKIDFLYQNLNQKNSEFFDDLLNFGKSIKDLRRTIQKLHLDPSNEVLSIYII